LFELATVIGKEMPIRTGFCGVTREVCGVCGVCGARGVSKLFVFCLLIDVEIWYGSSCSKFRFPLLPSLDGDDNPQVPLAIADGGGVVEGKCCALICEKLLEAN
jgi:hypothetical protein